MSWGGRIEYQAMATRRDDDRVSQELARAEESDGTGI
jgi:hypothetical protein